MLFIPRLGWGLSFLLSSFSLWDTVLTGTFMVTVAEENESSIGSHWGKELLQPESDTLTYIHNVLSRASHSPPQGSQGGQLSRR